jgi:hypothetical protein
LRDVVDGGCVKKRAVVHTSACAACRGIDKQGGVHSEVIKVGKHDPDLLDGQSADAVHIIKRASTGSSIKVELVSGSRVIDRSR